METFKGVAGVALILAIIAMIIGWLINFVAVIKAAAAGAAFTTLFVLKVVGIFAAPLGGILGLFF